MNNEPKIYPISDNSADNSEADHSDDHGAALDIPPACEEENEAAWDEQAIAQEPPRDILTIGMGIICVLLGLVWTGGYISVNRTIWAEGFTPNVLVSLINGWVGPIIVLLIAYALISRRRRADARYFERQVTDISEASHLLDERLRATNTELSMAREFLNNQSTQLESLGRTAIERLTERAENIRLMIDGSDQAMQSIAKVSAAAEKNLNALRTHMPVVITSAKDMTSQIGNAGNTAQTQLRDMIAGMKKVNTFGKATSEYVPIIESRISEAVAKWQEQISAIEASSARSGQHLSENAQQASRMLHEQEQTSLDAFRQFKEDFGSQLSDAAKQLEANLSEYRDAIANMAEQRAAESDAITNSVTDLGAQLATLREHMTVLDSGASDQVAKMAFSMTALNEQMASVNGLLETSSQATQSLTGHADTLAQRAKTLSTQLGDTLETEAKALADTLARSEAHSQQSRQELTAMMDQGQQLQKLLEDNALSLTIHEQHIEMVGGKLGSLGEEQSASILTIDEHLKTVEQRMQSLSSEGKDTLSAAFKDIQDNAAQRLADVEQQLMAVTQTLATTMGERSQQVLETAMRDKSEEVLGKLQLSLNKALGATREASVSLVDQLSKVDALAGNLEARVEQARERAELRTDQEFTRNMALITESLNSAAIDITKILSNDVTDTAWSAYLKGDRGVFTRRAVSLLNTGEVREIAQHYEYDTEFQATVNRYIHDFEAMLRDLLSTRNGEAISVTLLSSDMGKLYVALAQAIERFR